MENYKIRQSIVASSKKKLSHILCQWIVITGLALLHATTSIAATNPSCAAVFPQGLQSHHADGEISFDWNAQLLKNSSNNLIALRVNNYAWSVLSSCGTASCSATAQAVPELTIPFLYSSSTTDRKLGYRTNETLGSDSNNNFRTLDIDTEAQLSFTKIANDYRIKSLKLGYAATLNLAPGTYWIENISISSASRINVIGEGTVRIFVKGDVTFPWQAYANMESAGTPKSAAKLFVYTEGDFSLQTDAEVSAVVYTQKRLSLAQGKLYGAASFYQASLGTQSKVYYQQDAVSLVNLTGICSASNANTSTSNSPPVVTTPVDACRAVFPNGLQTYGDNGSVTFQYNAQLHNASNNLLITTKVQLASGSSKLSCVSSQCAANGSSIKRFDSHSFKQSTSTVNVSVPWMAIITIGDSTHLDYKNINVATSATLNLNLQAAAYHIKELTLGYNSTLKLPAGDYWIESLTMDSDSHVEIIGAGTVRLYIKNSLSLPWMASLNSNTQDAAKLIMYHYSGLELQTSSTVYGLVYSEADVKMGYQAQVFGGISASKIFLDTDSHVTYKSDAVALTKFGEICTTTDPLPDLTPPVLTLNQTAASTEANNIVITGTVTDPVQTGSGVASVAAVTSQGQRFTAILNGNNFTITVPLIVGDNSISVEARDFSTNLSTKTVVVKRTSVPHLQNLLPVDGTKFTLPTTTISGEITTAWSANNIQFTVNNIAQPLTLASDGLYRFNMPSVALTIGVNNFVIHVVTPDGNADATIKLSYAKPDRDGDGHPDDEDAFPNDPKEWADLDKDGIGDNSDPDRDGDGFNNDIEQQKGTDLNNAKDYPDTVAPVVQVTTQSGQTLDSDSIQVIGTVSDPVQPHSGLGTIVAVTSKGQRIPATLSLNYFVFFVPLSLGDNTITIEARDLSNNLTTKTLSVKRISAPRIQNIVPADGSKFTTLSTNITGEVRTAWPLGNIQFTVNSTAQTLVAVSDGVYRFTLSNVTLKLGVNSFILHATTPDGNADVTINLSYAKPDRDGDGHPDDEDAFPNDPKEWSDLDKDGIGDNSDPDRDGDGFNNDIETQRSTDPNNAKDYPDTVAPVLQVTTPSGQTLEAETIQIIGTVSDPVQPHSGLGKIVAITSKGEQISATLTLNYFVFFVPLSLGENTITIEARDLSNNLTTKTISITRTSIPHLQNIVPADGAKLTVPSTNITGEVRTAWPLANIQFTANGTAQTLVAASAGLYRFTMTGVALKNGVNTFVFSAITPDGNANATINLSYAKPDRDGDGHPDDEDAFPDDPKEWSDLDKDGIGDNSDPDRDGDGFNNDVETQRGTDPNNAKDYPDTIAPSVQVTTADHQSLEANSLIVVGTVTDPVQPHSGLANVIVISAKGQHLNATLNGNNFSVTVPLELGDNIITIEARDLSNNLTTKTLTEKRTAIPVILNVLPASGTKLTVPSTSITGEVHTAWPLSNIQFTLNNAAQTLVASGEGVYRFAINNVALNVGANNFLLRAITPDGKAEVTINLTYTKPDRDGDGHPDDEDAFPDNPNEWSDLDKDGIGDNSDPDRDGDGISNDYETQLGTNPNDATSTPPDRDHDGIPDQLDDDRDGDGHPNAQDAFPDDPLEWSDMDGDGIGDNSDTDRDGDGFTNSVEQNAGTNPNDAADYPDTVAPILQILNASNERVGTSTLILRGTATDPVQPHSGIDIVRVSSDKYPDFNVSATLSDGGFTAEIPLALGTNILRISAVDKSGNHIEETHTVQRISGVRLNGITPANGSVISADKVTIAGQVLTQLPLDDVRFYINEWQVTPSGTTTAGIYTFNLPNISLQLGQNIFVLRVVAADATEESQLVLTRTPANSDQIPAPKLSIVTPVSGTQLRDASFRLKGHAVSQAGIASVTINGSPANLSSSLGQDSYFDGLITFPSGQDNVSVVIDAVDALGKHSSLTASYLRDGSAPQITIDGGIQPIPVINPVLHTPFTVSGTVIDSNLASMTLNDQPIQLQLDTTPGHYRFSVPVKLEPGAQTQLSFSAYDISGNQTNVEYGFKSTAQASISPLLPGDATELISSGEPIVLQVAARLAEIKADNTVIVTSGSTQTQLTIAGGTLASGEITLPATAGDYVLNYQVLDSSQQMIASASRKVRVIDEQAIAVKLLRHNPELGANNIEPNQPIELYFNKAIDAAKLSITVRETLHGNTYLNLDESGTDFLHAQGYQLQEVHRDNESVTGGISLLPGNQNAAFYTSRQFGYNADVNVEVNYDGKEMSRFNFKVRPLPTFVIGAIADQFGQPLVGVKVSLSASNRTTTTNKDGGFAFGFQEQPGNEIPEGRYKLIVNPEFSLPGYGTQVRTITLQAGHKNELGLLRLPELSPEIPFQLVSSGESIVSLASDDLRLNLSSAKLLFNNGRTSGNVQAQFMPFEQLNSPIAPGAWPQWMFALQPRGVNVEGSVGIDLKMPALRGAYDYLPADMVYVVLLGYNQERGVIEPIGIGKIENYRVTSVGKLKIQSLDYLGYAIVKPAQQALLKDVADGKQTLQQLLSVLQQ